MPAYEFFEHTADIGVRVNGATVAELFTHAAQALAVAMGKLEKIGERKQKSIELQAESLEDLLHDWLTELLYEVDARQVWYDEWEITGVQPGKLTATIRGNAIDFSRSRPRAEIKAVTYHRLRVEQLPDKTWRATVIFDV